MLNDLECCKCGLGIAFGASANLTLTKTGYLCDDCYEKYLKNNQK